MQLAAGRAATAALATVARQHAAFAAVARPRRQAVAARAAKQPDSTPPPPPTTTAAAAVTATTRIQDALAATAADTGLSAERAAELGKHLAQNWYAVAGDVAAMSREEVLSMRLPVKVWAKLKALLAAEDEASPLAAASSASVLTAAAEADMAAASTAMSSVAAEAAAAAAQQLPPDIMQRRMPRNLSGAGAVGPPHVRVRRAPAAATEAYALKVCWRLCVAGVLQTCSGQHSVASASTQHRCSCCRRSRCRRSCSSSGSGCGTSAVAGSGGSAWSRCGPCRLTATARSSGALCVRMRWRSGLVRHQQSRLA
jgi:hypothetical protein